MDNVIQNIKIEDIIPSNFQQSNNDPKQLETLASSIKQFGIMEPLLVRPKNGKYEIILGTKRYKAAKMIGLKTVPALVKNVDDEVVMKYMMINNIQTNSNSQQESTDSKSKFELNNNLSSNDTKRNQNNSDIVNLAELNINKEEERDDFKMNNEQFNNNLMNNNLGGQSNSINNQTPQEPTFGGRFFPSLEDEPTNMNMGSPINSGAIPSQNTNIPPQNNNINNLIDLTDTTMEKDQTMPNNFQNQNISPASNLTQNTTTIEPIQPMNAPMNNEISNQISPSPDNIINLDNLQNAYQPNIPPQNTMGIENSMTPPTMQQNNSIPQFDMSQSMMPNQFVQNQEFNQAPNTNQNDFSSNQPQTPQTFEQSSIQQPTVESPNIPTYNQENFQSTYDLPAEENIPTQKTNAIPIMNTIKNVATSLEAFGNKIMASEEETPTTIKLTIEVEK